MNSKNIFIPTGIALLILTSVVLSPQSVHACSCATPKTAPDELKESDAVFSGEVRDVSSRGGENSSGMNVVTFSVDRIWKGNVTKTQKIYTAASSASCGYNFSKGELYLVYTTQSNGSELHTGLCSRTANLDATDDIETLGDAKKVLPSAQSHGEDHRMPSNERSNIQRQLTDLRFQLIERLREAIRNLQQRIDRVLSERETDEEPPGNTGSVVSSLEPQEGPIGSDITIAGDALHTVRKVILTPESGPGIGILQQRHFEVSPAGDELTFAFPSHLSHEGCLENEKCPRVAVIPETGVYNVSVHADGMEQTRQLVFTLTGDPGLREKPESEEGGVSVSVRTSKNVYDPNETIAFSITAANNTGQPERLGFSSTCQTSYTIGGYNSEVNRVCGQAITRVIIDPGDTHTWDHKHDLSEQSLSPGEYTLKGYVEGLGSAKTELDISAF